MKWTFARFGIGAAFSLAGLVSSASAQGVQDQIKKLEMDRAAAVVAGDVATLDKLTADDFTFIHPDGQMTGKAQTMDAIKAGQIKLTSNTVSDLKVRMYGDVAVVTGKADLEGTAFGQNVTGQVMFTRVYVKKDGRWQSVAYQQTAVAKP